ncbi:MAG: AI-2E family transporter [Deltaproteobacteria bacterium]|nr:MAG: AI-2E family transporter [Deltaproteobacteria bacterium]
MAVIERTRLQQSTFLVLFALAAYAFWRTLEPIWVPVLLGLVIAVGVYPVQQRLLLRFGGKHPGLPAAAVTALVMVLTLAIVTFLVFVVGQRLLEFARQLAANYEKKGAAGLLGHDLNALLSRFGVSPDEINRRIAELARDFAAFLGKGATSIVTGLFTAVFIFIFTAITSYYLLREGTGGTSWLVEMVPLPNGQVAEIVRDVRDVTRAMLFSTAVMSAYQGITAWIGYWIFGVDSPLVWAALTGVASILPAVGTALVWVPVGIVAIIIGHPAQGRRLHPAAEAGGDAHQDERPPGVHRHLRRHRGVRNPRRRPRPHRGSRPAFPAAHLSARLPPGGTGARARSHAARPLRAAERSVSVRRRGRASRASRRAG